MEQKRNGTTHKLVTLFVAAALVAATGCGARTPANSNCVDANGDGYCDNSSGGSGGTSYRGYTGTGGGSVSSGLSSSADGTGSSSGISSGTAAHGGIGSSSHSSSS